MHMRWHAENDNKDEILRHPRDGELWKRFDTKYPEFTSDPRNVRLRLATDGFNSFGTMSTNYSIWPVILFPYNLPPWLFMKQSKFIFSMIILGPRTNEMFKMRATLIRTVSDFSGLDILSDWNTHTGLVCPFYNFNAEPCRLRHSRKWCFIGHLRFLSRNHKFRLMRHRFDGNVEERTPPKKLSGSESLQQLKDINVTFGRQSEKVDENDECKLAAFVIPKNKKVAFLKTLKNISVPDGYSSNISRRINLDQKRIFGSKSNDCHILMQQLLPIAIRNVLPRQVVATLVEFSSLFRQLCLKSLSLVDLDKLQNQIVETLCHLEILFPPSFFTVMIHLTVHLVDEVKKGGQVHYRWMYFVERLLGHFKSLVGNKAQPEGSIAESYIVEEALTLYSRYFVEIESMLNRPKRVNDEPSQNEAYEKSSMFPQQGKHVGGFIAEPLTHLEKTQAHRYVLLNCVAVKPFIEDYIKRSTRGRRLFATKVERRVSKEFHDWFSKRIINPDIEDTISDEMKFLVQDRHATKADLPYYEKLEDIVELNYYGKCRIVLFKCQWVDTTRNRGFKIDA
ncbi:hypothetical protein P3L10_021293 [Capsicum annuum]